MAAETRPCMGWLDLLHRRRLDAGFWRPPYAVMAELVDALA
jgi:hypothetical protein